MSRADLIALIALVKAARGPDRDLDAEIARTRLPADADDIARSRGGWSYRVFGPEGWDDEWMEVLPYTGSLDAAASLVPDGWQWVCGQDRPQNGGAWADVQPNIVGVTKVRAATPALALTAAALRARLASMGDDA